MLLGHRRALFGRRWLWRADPRRVAIRGGRCVGKQAVYDGPDCTLWALRYLTTPPRPPALLPGIHSDERASLPLPVPPLLYLYSNM